MTTRGKPSDRRRGYLFKAHGLTVALQAEPDALDRVQVAITSAGTACHPPVPMRIVEASEVASALADRQTEPLVHYPGRARHPAGTDAALSWFNDEGEGWLRIVRPDQAVILLPLQGWQRPAEATAIPRRGRRGPPKSMDLWLAVAALLRPLGLDGVLLQEVTGINRFNVYDWLSRATTAGLLLRLDGWAGRRDRFIVPPAQVPVLGEYIRTTWEDWRHGRTVARLRPTVRYFVATAEWQAFADLGGKDIIPTGVTWLEGHGGGNPILGPQGNVPRLTFFCRAMAWERLVEGARIAPRNERQRPYDSEAMILAEDHPIWSITEQRHDDAFTPAWPAGFRALDAMRDPEPRVRDAAERAWRDWLELHRRHVEQRTDAAR